MEDYINSVVSQIKKESDYFNKAKLIQNLVKEKNVSIKRISDLLSMNASYICHILRLNRLPEIIVDGYYSKLVTLSHLYILSRIKDAEKMMAAYEKILEENLSVLQTEELIRKVLYDLSSDGSRITDDELQELATQTMKDKDVKVLLTQTRIKSKLIIEVKGNLEQTSKVLKKYISKLES